MYNELPEEIIEALEESISDGALEFADNFRAYRHRDGKFQDEYTDAYNRGCCGFFDTEYTDLYGDTWTIGCNHGH